MTNRIKDQGFRIEKSGLRSEDRGLRRGTGFSQSSILNPQSCWGFTLIELVVVIIIIVVLMGVALDRFRFYQELAEKVAMEGVVSALDSALILQYGQIMTRGKAGDVAVLARDNPMNWLQKRQRNYAGEFYNPSPQAVESGNWLFDLKSRELIYVIHNRDHFKPGSDGKPWIRFHVATRYDRSRLPSLQDAPPELTGVVLEPVEPYVWF